MLRCLFVSNFQLCHCLIPIIIAQGLQGSYQNIPDNLKVAHKSLFIYFNRWVLKFWESKMRTLVSDICTVKISASRYLSTRPLSVKIQRCDETLQGCPAMGALINVKGAVV